MMFIILLMIPNEHMSYNEFSDIVHPHINSVSDIYKSYELYLKFTKKCPQCSTKMKYSLQYGKHIYSCHGCCISYKYLTEFVFENTMKEYNLFINTH